jgi:hypothetical protein
MMQRYGGLETKDEPSESVRNRNRGIDSAQGEERYRLRSRHHDPALSPKHLEQGLHFKFLVESLMPVSPRKRFASVVRSTS